jgi:hypothetical protein
MKLANTLISALFVLTISFVTAADEVKTVNIGAAEVFYNYQPTDTGVAILTLIAQVPETNNSLRGLKNVDQRRLSKLGQLIYQCKLMLYQSDKDNGAFATKKPILIAKNYSLFTGVDLPLDADERVGIKAEALQTFDDNSLFSATLGGKDTLKQMWETQEEGTVNNLRQFNVNVLNDTDLIETSESIDIVARFPIFQLEKPVSQWSYNFSLKDFKQAIRHIDENCTPTRLRELIKQKT